MEQSKEKDMNNLGDSNDDYNHPGGENSSSKDSQSSKSISVVLDVTFIIVMVLCILGIGAALYFFCKSISSSHSMTSNIENALAKKIYFSKTDNFEYQAYFDLLMQLEDLKASANQTSILTFLYQFVSGTLIGVAGYLIKTSAERVKLIERDASKVDRKFKSINRKISKVKEETSALQTNSANLEKDIKNLSINTETNIAKLNELDKNIGSTKTLVSELQTSSSGLKTDIDRLCANTETNAVKLKELDVNIDSTKTLVSELQTSSSGLKTDIDRLCANTETNAVKLNELDVNIGKTNTQYNSIAKSQYVLNMISFVNRLYSSFQFYYFIVLYENKNSIQSGNAKESLKLSSRIHDEIEDFANYISDAVTAIQLFETIEERFDTVNKMISEMAPLGRLMNADKEEFSSDQKDALEEWNDNLLSIIDSLRSVLNT